MVEVFGVQFAPVNIPFRRRLQTLAVMHFIFGFLAAPLLVVVLGIYILFHPHYWWTLGLYGLWYAYDRNVPKQGGRSSIWFRKSVVWKYLRDYFPASLEKTVDLDPGKNYIFGQHPHGILSCGAFINFGTDATGFPMKFPGLDPHLITLVCQFYWPIRREYISLSGKTSNESWVHFKLA